MDDGNLEFLDASAPDETEAEALLREWFVFWRTHEDLPVKLPEGLHIRTAVYLTNAALRPARPVEHY